MIYIGSEEDGNGKEVGEKDKKGKEEWTEGRKN